MQEVVACGTEDVLTCHVIILRDPATRVTAIAHFDEFSRVWDFAGLARDFLDKVAWVRHHEEWEYREGEDEGDWEWWEEGEEEEGDLTSAGHKDHGMISILAGLADLFSTDCRYNLRTAFSGRLC